jgi:starch-binding outer membrane protein, SusD/RagB family
MKSKYIILGLLIAMTFSSCEDLLEREPYSVVTSQNMWNDESDVRAGIIGMYDQFRSTFDEENFLVYFELRSGFWQTGASGAGQWDDLFMNTPNSSSTPGLNWTPFYKIINAANLAIKYIPEIEFNDEEEAAALLADAYFARAFTYFALAKIWGDVPLTISPYESAEDENMFPSREDVAVVFEQIKSDVDMALEQIPDDDPRERVFASEASINMLKADVYLWTAKRLNGGDSDLQDAEQAVDAVLANSNYQLLSDYEKVFRQELNDEIIFCLYFDILESTNQYGRMFLYQAGQVDAEYWENPIPISTSSQWLTYTDDYVNPYLMADASDTRSGVINQDYDTGSKVYRWVNKYLGEVVSETRNDVTDTRIYRYAEAILFKAEIANALDRPAEAVEELNKIAKRAYGVDDYYSSALSQVDVDDAILHERLIEFGAEGKSWFDIIRFGKAFDIIPSLVGRENEYEGNILLFPVATGTISKNPNIEQTPGF